MLKLSKNHKLQKRIMPIERKKLVELRIIREDTDESKKILMNDCIILI